MPTLENLENTEGTKKLIKKITTPELDISTINICVPLPFSLHVFHLFILCIFYKIWFIQHVGFKLFI